MDLRRQLSVLRRWWLLLVGSALIAAGAAYLASAYLPRWYEARTTLIVGQSLSAVNPTSSQLQASQQLSQTYAEVATTWPILEQVIKGLDLGTTTGDLSGRVSARAATDSTLVTITAEDQDPARAASIANAVADQLVAASPTLQGRQTGVQSFVDDEIKSTQAQIQTTQTQIEALTSLSSLTADQQQQLQSLQDRLASLQATYASLVQYSSDSAANLLSVVEPALAPVDPVSPRPLLNTLLATVIGLVAAAGIAYFAEFLDDTLKSADDVEQWLGLPTLGTIARMRGDAGRHEMYRLATLFTPRSPTAEAYRALRTNVEFASVDEPLRAIVVTSSVQKEGKTTTAGNLAIALAQSGKRTLLVDADLRKPGLDSLFDLPNATGLTTLLRSEAAEPAQCAQGSEQENLQVLTSGPLPPNPAELLGSQRMQALLATLLGAYDLVVIDTPPLHVATDAAVLSSFVDGTVLVVDASRTRRAAIKQGRAALARVDARVLGVVLNRLSAHGREDGYQYYEEYYGPRATRHVPEAESTPADKHGLPS